MVIIVRSNDIVLDPRVMKYVRFLQEKGIRHCLIGWDRDGIQPQIANAFFWERRAGYNVGGMKAAWNRLGWMFFVLRTLIRINADKPVLHGCDVDSAFPCAVYKLFHTKTKLIFDIFDWFSATLYNQSKLILLVFKIIEYFTLKLADNVIICEPERIEQIPYSIPESRIKILPNIPFFKNDGFLKIEPSYGFGNNLLTFSYVGNFAASRCLEELVEIAEEGYINLAIAGFGNAEITSLVEQAGKCDNIKYYGKVSYMDGLNISYNSDIMYAMYSTSNPNHIYAAPNKFYEAMYLGKPIFTTKGIIVENKVKRLAIGFISGESKNEIIESIKAIRKDDIRIFGTNSRICWKRDFENRTEIFLETDYMALIIS